jgi:hypothetical protein
MTFAGKISAAALSALVLGASLASTTGTAEARNGRHAAAIGGLAAGAILGGAIAGANRSYAAPVYGEPSYAYGSPGYETYEAPVVVQQNCWRERQEVYDSYGVVVGWRNVRVCQ